MDSEMHRLIKLVMGEIRVSRHALRSQVGRKSSEQVESEEARMARRTSS